MRRFTLLACLLGSGCLGSDNGPHSSGAGGGVGAQTAAQCTNDGPAPGSTLIRRLTNAEYNNTVRDLLGDTTQPANAFPADNNSLGFTNNAATQSIDGTLAAAYASAAAALSANANLGAIEPCASGTIDAACAQKFIADFGKSAWRRPLTADESASMLAFYNAQTADAATNLRSVIEVMIQSPQFLYRPEIGIAGTAGSVVALTPYEVATRLSYFLWETMPDATLLAAADAGQLSTPDQIAAQVTRMLADTTSKVSRAHASVEDFHTQWLQLSRILDPADIAKDPTLYPQFDPTQSTTANQLRSTLMQETLQFIDEVIWNGAGDLQTLFTAPYTMMNGALASYYDSANPAVTGDTWQKVTLDPTQRAGLLTQAVVMTILAHDVDSSPTRRGKFVLSNLFCSPPPPPPNGMPAADQSDLGASATTRERMAAHATNPACAACHNLMDPIGFGLENFDAIGMWRDTQNGQTIDASGTLPSELDVAGNFNGPIGLVKGISQSTEVKSCFVQQWFDFANGHNPTPADQCALSSLTTQFQNAQGKIQPLLTAITQSDPFRYRIAVAPTLASGGN